MSTDSRVEKIRAVFPQPKSDWADNLSLLAAEDALESLAAQADCGGINCGKCQQCLTVHEYFLKESITTLRAQREALLEDARKSRVRRDTAEAALAELVALKDGPKDKDYERRKPAAWEAARLAVSRVLEASEAASQNRAGRIKDPVCDSCGFKPDPSGNHNTDWSRSGILWDGVVVVSWCPQCGGETAS